MTNASQVEARIGEQGDRNRNRSYKEGCRAGSCLSGTAAFKTGPEKIMQETEL